MAKTPIDKLDSAIEKILTEYGDDVTKNVAEITKDIAKKGAQAVRQSAGIFHGSGDYAKGWTSEVQNKRYATEAVIYNRTKPGLAHLLENGHAKVGGGRVDGQPHIKPVEEKIVKEYEEGVINAINSD